MQAHPASELNGIFCPKCLKWVMQKHDLTLKAHLGECLPNASIPANKDKFGEDKYNTKNLRCPYDPQKFGHEGEQCTEYFTGCAPIREHIITAHSMSFLGWTCPECSKKPEQVLEFGAYPQIFETSAQLADHYQANHDKEKGKGRA
jgi:hypothetical protein